MCSEHPQCTQSLGTVASDVTHMLRCRQFIVMPRIFRLETLAIQTLPLHVPYYYRLHLCSSFSWPAISVSPVFYDKKRCIWLYRCNTCLGCIQSTTIDAPYHPVFSVHWCWKTIGMLWFVVVLQCLVYRIELNKNPGTSPERKKVFHRAPPLLWL